MTETQKKPALKARVAKAKKVNLEIDSTPQVERPAAPAVRQPLLAVPGFTIEVGAGSTPVDEGVYPARIFAMLALGVQAPMAGSTAPARQQVAIGFCLFGATREGVEASEPTTMYRRYNVVFGLRAELPKVLRAILGRDPEPGETLAPGDWIGTAVQVAVEHGTRTDGAASARVSGVMRCAVQRTVPALELAPLLYPGKTALDALPEWAQTAIAGQLHPAAAAPGGAAAEY